VIDAERGVLPGLEGKRPAGRDLDQPEIFREIAPFDDGGPVVLIARRRQMDFAHSPYLVLAALAVLN
jgi:hypothetical protein